MIHQYDVFLMALDPVVGHEISKSRPCVIVSPDEMNQYLSTVIMAPMTTKSHPYPSRVSVNFEGKSGWVVLDQIRTVDKKRLVRRMGRIEEKAIHQLKSVIREMLID